MDYRKPETGAFFQRDRSWHPPAFTPGYKTSVARSPRYALLSLNNTLSELTGPVFGHSMIGELDNDLIRNYARPGESPIGRSPTFPVDFLYFRHKVISICQAEEFFLMSRGVDRSGRISSI